jgi:hypothetical protein
LCCSVYFLCCSMYFCVVLCIVCFVSFSVLFVCICVLNYCHRVATQLQLNISYHIISYHIISYHIISYHIIQNCSEIISLLFTDANTYTIIGVASLQAAPFMCAPIMVYIFVSVHHTLMISLHFCILELIIWPNVLCNCTPWWLGSGAQNMYEFCKLKHYSVCI